MTHLGDKASCEQAYDYLMRRQNVPKYSCWYAKNSVSVYV